MGWEMKHKANGAKISRNPKENKLFLFLGEVLPSKHSQVATKQPHFSSGKTAIKKY